MSRDIFKPTTKTKLALIPKFLPIILSTSIFLPACKNTDRQKTALKKTPGSAAALTNNVDTYKNGNYLKFEQDSVVIASFQIEAGLNDRATEKITREQETLILHAFFEGTPKDVSNAQLEEDGSFFRSSCSKGNFIPDKLQNLTT